MGPVKNSVDIARAVADLARAGTSFVCVTLASARGSVPQEVGAKLLVTRAGAFLGTVGGGRVEAAAIRFAGDLMKDPGSQPCHLVEWNLQKDIGMTCGGVVGFLFEVFHQHTWQVVIFGAGHVSQALCRVLSALDCRVSVYDDRPEFLALVPSSLNIETHRSSPLENAVGDLPEGSYVVVMTRGHRTDKPILERCLLDRNFPYLGVIGSQSKAAVLRKELREAGVADEAAFRCPIGLPLGKDTPEEIAISIAAELLQVRGA
ncbi:MAG: xanthine dehydrogenase accessory protein XdhC [Terrimicrobiaceae bacterium]